MAPLVSKTKRQGRFICHPPSISALPQILRWFAPYLGRTLKGEVALALSESCSISFSRCHEIHLATEIGISSENREPQGESWPTPGHRIQAEQTAAVKALSYKFLWQNQLAGYTVLSYKEILGIAETPVSLKAGQYQDCSSSRLGNGDKDTCLRYTSSRQVAQLNHAQLRP